MGDDGAHGGELAAATQPLLAGLDTPKVLAASASPSSRCAIQGNGWRSWFRACVRARRRRRRARGCRGDERRPFVLDGEAGHAPGSLARHADQATARTCCSIAPSSGEVEQDFADSPPPLNGPASPAAQAFRRDGELGPLARGARRLRLGDERFPTRPRWVVVTGRMPRKCSPGPAEMSARAPDGSAAASFWEGGLRLPAGMRSMAIEDHAAWLVTTPFDNASMLLTRWRWTGRLCKRSSLKARQNTSQAPVLLATTKDMSGSPLVTMWTV